MGASIFFKKESCTYTNEKLKDKEEEKATNKSATAVLTLKGARRGGMGSVQDCPML